MSNEAVRIIRETEERAAAIRKEAADTAKKLVADARAQGEADCKKAEAEARAEAQRKINEATQKSLELTEKTTAEAKAKADGISAAARSRMEQAENIIIRELMKKCRLPG
ncbi:MAG: hypothetical protein GX057_00770 [Clostridiales bacterium]|mgnify:FL=1|nr:hypothetical protein [Clostridiales bacterium]